MNKWGQKVITIEEVQDLKKLELDDLLGKLLTHEIYLKEDEGESSKKGISTLKVTKEEEPTDHKKEHSLWLWLQ